MSRQADPESTRRDILRAARKLFIERGFSGTSIKAIATEANVTKSLIFHHFGSKEGLWQEMAHRAYDGYHKAQMALFESTAEPFETLIGSIRAHFEFHKQNPEILRLEMWEELDNLKCEKKQDDAIQEGLRRFREGQEKGLVRPDVPPVFLIMSFLALTHYWFFMKRRHKELFGPDVGILDNEDSDEAYMEAVLKIYLDGIMTGSGGWKAGLEKE